MTTHPDRVVMPQSSTLPEPRLRGATSTVQELRVAILRQRVAALEQQLELERERRQAVVDRYERLLAER